MEMEKNWIGPADKATLVENRKPRYKSSIVQGFPGWPVQTHSREIVKTLINVRDGLSTLTQIRGNIWSEFLTYVRF